MMKGGTGMIMVRIRSGDSCRGEICKIYMIQWSLGISWIRGEGRGRF